MREGGLERIVVIKKWSRNRHGIFDALHVEAFGDRCFYSQRLRHFISPSHHLFNLVARSSSFQNSHCGLRYESCSTTVKFPGFTKSCSASGPFEASY